MDIGGLNARLRNFSNKVYGADEWSYNQVEMHHGSVYAIYYDYKGFTAKTRQAPEGTWVDVEMPSFLKDLILEFFPGSPVHSSNTSNS